MRRVMLGKRSNLKSESQRVGSAGAAMMGDGSDTELPLADMIVLRQLHSAAVNGEKQVLHRLCSGHRHCIDIQDSLGRTALTLAILTNRVECVRLLVQRYGARVDITDHTGRTALHWAAHRGNSECVHLLLQAAPLGVGANTSAATIRGHWLHYKDREGHTALHLATRHASGKCLGLIVKQLLPGEIDVEDSEKRIALHWAALYAHVPHVRMLIRNGSNVGVADVNGQSPLHCAASSMRPGTLACMKILLEECAGIINWQDYGGQTVLHLSVVTGSDQLVQAVLTVSAHYMLSAPAHGPASSRNTNTGTHCNVNTLDNMFRTPLHWAAQLGYASIVKILLDAGAECSSSDMNGATPLHYAAQLNHHMTVEALMCHVESLGGGGGEDMRDVEGRTPLMWACAAGANDTIRVLLQHGADVNDTDTHGRTGLHACCACGHVESCQLMLRHGAHASCRDVRRQTPLALASQHGHSGIIKCLLHDVAQGQSGQGLICCVDSEGQTPLHWSALSGHASTCHLLIESGCVSDSRDHQGRTPLHQAAYRGHVSCINTLLEAGGADIDIQDNMGMSALHWAALSAHYDAVRTLVQCGAYINHVTHDENRFTPLDCALSSSRDDHAERVAQYLVMEGALTAGSVKNIAATRIQCVFRGYKVRKTFVQQKSLLVKHEQLKKVVARRKSQDAMQVSSSLPKLLESHLDTEPDRQQHHQQLPDSSAALTTGSTHTGGADERGQFGSSMDILTLLPDLSLSPPSAQQPPSQPAADKLDISQHDTAAADKNERGETEWKVPESAELESEKSDKLDSREHNATSRRQQERDRHVSFAADTRMSSSSDRPAAVAVGSGEVSDKLNQPQAQPLLLPTGSTTDSSSSGGRKQQQPSRAEKSPYNSNKPAAAATSKGLKNKKKKPPASSDGVVSSGKKQSGGAPQSQAEGGLPHVSC